MRRSLHFFSLINAFALPLSHNVIKNLTVCELNPVEIGRLLLILDRDGTKKIEKKGNFGLPNRFFKPSTDVSFVCDLLIWQMLEEATNCS